MVQLPNTASLLILVVC